ncbi:hypothetical protein, conserved [Trypanosoma brucei gambiense DAL972]|uniref:Uncharacterized protein n=1 Tax=Trypanosoma brucei gambiense (strain MHOM/CI/86/DAL972) TaxID=679716 RepID=D0A809_TRYB9|nr:hypothetical protein, conserved [Trypanosoma brucei gambiense DAL972]CBH17810.1 hypothetical protein, conserved [Trypanosoma brucei gambiense DAL972]|eukprot:XP_011780074.1 hypothetical protein, conserved [Trypanosoma brucei gambiense DAL972]
MRGAPSVKKSLSYVSNTRIRLHPRIISCSIFSTLVCCLLSSKADNGLFIRHHVFRRHRSIGRVLYSFSYEGPGRPCAYTLRHSSLLLLAFMGACLPVAGTSPIDTNTKHQKRIVPPLRSCLVVLTTGRGVVWGCDRGEILKGKRRNLLQ